MAEKSQFAEETEFPKKMRKSINYTKDRIFLTYCIFSVIRVLLVFIPQHGIIHPDEFFQSVEPMAGQ